jgi:hypothetical protein
MIIECASFAHVQRAKSKLNANMAGDGLFFQPRDCYLSELRFLDALPLSSLGFRA